MPRNPNVPLHIPPDVRDDAIKHLEAVERIFSNLESDKYATLADDLNKYIKKLRARKIADDEGGQDWRDTIADELEGLL